MRPRKAHAPNARIMQLESLDIEQLDSAPASPSHDGWGIALNNSHTLNHRRCFSVSATVGYRGWNCSRRLLVDEDHDGRVVPSLLTS